MKKILYFLPRIIVWLFTISLLVIFTGSLVVKCNSGEIKYLSIPLTSGIVSFLSWKKPIIGGVVFTIFGILIITFKIFGSNGPIEFDPIFIVGVPLLIAGILFFVEGTKKTKVNKKPQKT